MIENQELSEISGIAPCSFHPGLFWVHNDGGNEPYLYLIDTFGVIQSKVSITNAKNRDWEDLTIGQENGVSYLYIGDIGNNRRLRENVQVYKIREPQSIDKEFEVTAEIMHLSYTNGPRDAETLMYDQQTNELIIVTKRELRTYVYSFPFKDSSVTVAPFGRINHQWITGGDISPEGDILLKNYGHVFYWKARKQLNAAKRLTTTKSKNIRYRREPLGEAICWNPLGGFISISERFGKKPIKIYQYTIRK